MEKEEKTFGMLCHILGFCGCIVPFGNIIGPLVIWLIKKDESAFVDRHGKESINFQISLTIYGLIGGVLILAAGIGVVLLIALLIFAIVMIIKAAIKANDGEEFTYPLCIRFL